MIIFMPPSIHQGHIGFDLSVCLSAETLTLAIAFEW